MSSCIYQIFKDILIVIGISAFFWKYYLIGLIIISLNLIATILTFCYATQTIAFTLALTSMCFYGLDIIIALSAAFYFYFTQMYKQTNTPSHAGMMSGQAKLLLFALHTTFINLGIIGLCVFAIVLFFFIL